MADRVMGSLPSKSGQHRQHRWREIFLAKWEILKKSPTALFFNDNANAQETEKQSVFQKRLNPNQLETHTPLFSEKAM